MSVIAVPVSCLHKLSTEEAVMFLLCPSVLSAFLSLDVNSEWMLMKCVGGNHYHQQMN